MLLREHGTTDTRPARIVVSCEEGGAEITVAMGDASRTSTVSLGALAAEHRARAIALAAAELVHAMIGAPPPAARPPPPTVAALSATAAPAADSPAMPVVGRPALLVGGLAQWLGQPAALLFGARATIRYPLGEILVPALSVDGALGSVSAPSAEVAAAEIAAGVHLYAGKTTGHFRLEAGQAPAGAGCVSRVARMPGRPSKAAASGRRGEGRSCARGSRSARPIAALPRSRSSWAPAMSPSRSAVFVTEPLLSTRWKGRGCRSAPSWASASDSNRGPRRIAAPMAPWYWCQRLVRVLPQRARR